jgi:hypothetical protein
MFREAASTPVKPARNLHSPTSARALASGLHPRPAPHAKKVKHARRRIQQNKSGPKSFHMTLDWNRY